jgi:maltose alpha-D-glucosyltransferase / alpha-amylase
MKFHKIDPQARRKRHERLSRSVFYQIYPPSFADANGDGIGDLSGMIAKLPYLEDLGVDVLWLCPIFESPFKDGGYDVSDFFKVDPRYGDNETLQELCQQAKRRGISICLDLVAGHTSDAHPWFKEACKVEAGVERDRYIWSNDPWLTRYRDSNFMSGNADRHGSYMVNFFCHQPALNFGYGEISEAWQQAVDAPGPLRNRQMLREVITHWVGLGVGGFRVDMAHSLVKQDPARLEIRLLWRELRAWLDDYSPETFLISEFGNPEMAMDSGYDVDFMLHWGVPGYNALMFNETGWLTRPSCFFQAAAKGDFNEFYRSFALQQERVAGKGFISLPTANHDFQRPNCGSRSPEETFNILLFVFTWANLPTLYYGDEIAMRYLDGLPSKEGGFQRTGTRTPMQWDDSPNAGFSTASAGQLYLPLDPDPMRPSVAAQQDDPLSHLNFTKALIRLRKSHPALLPEAPCIWHQADSAGYPLLFSRTDPSGSLLIAINPSNQACEVDLPRDYLTATPLLTRKLTLNGNRLHLQPFGGGVFAV